MPESLKTLFSRQKRERREVFSHLLEEGKLSHSPRATKEEIRIAYSLILETSRTPKAALRHLEHSKKKEEGWEGKVKHSPIPSKIRSYVIDFHSDHPMTKLMEELGCLDKKALRRCSTLNSLLNTLYRQVKVTRKLKDLSETVDKLVIKSLDVEDRLKSIESQMNLDKQKALQMLEEGYNNNHISKVVGKHRNTISRWKKELIKSKEEHTHV